ncbi:unnamed protein product [Larinioides sclopetarius]|uniref:Uncharacterized protein n=1 Tax=Larinioides sclopetarius TaxID=280406 RepID=A0AAV2C0D2_9ARAC
MALGAVFLLIECSCGNKEKLILYHLGTPSALLRFHGSSLTDSPCISPGSYTTDAAMEERDMEPTLPVLEP